ncbi:MAG: PLP-dependent aminotransferase family protein [Desulfobacterales bacterium]|jgi:DNA-binding transcriptional MocR family regulator
MQITQLDVPKGMINLGIGQPSISLLPVDILRQAAAHRSKKGDPSILQYGTEPGNGYFRLALSKFLSDGYGIPVGVDQLFVTAGATQGLNMICTYFTRPGDTIFVEEPSYFLALHLFADCHLNVVSLPVDTDGLIIDALEEKLRKHQPAFIYTVPTFHNPSTVTLSADRREKLVDLSATHDFFIVADEVYHLLAYTVTPPPPMMAYDTAGTVLSLGSFSKILAPGLRLGWIHAAPDLFSRLAQSGLLLSGGGLNPFTSGVVQSVLELGLQHDHLSYLKEIYTKRSAALSAALHDHLPPDVGHSEPQGGFFIWLCLPEQIDAETFRNRARDQMVDFQPGIHFSSRQTLRNHIRLSYSYYEVAELREGVRRLAGVISER